MAKVEMRPKDIEAVIAAADTLAAINAKYGFPRGMNPFGIVIEAILNSKRKGEKECSVADSQG